MNKTDLIRYFRSKSILLYYSMLFNKNIPDGGTPYLSSIPDIIHLQIAEDLRNE